MHQLYRGVWPQNVSKLAKYAVRFIDGVWKVTVQYEAGEGLRFLAVEGEGQELANIVNSVKVAVGDGPGGAFYVNEYRHVIVPVRGDGSNGSEYYWATRLVGDLLFAYEGRTLTTKPLGADGTTLSPGDSWEGPRPGIPYVLAAGGKDIYYDTPALTDDNPPRVRERVTRKVLLSRVLTDQNAVRRAIHPISTVRGYQGGRFYVNESSAIFTPVGAGDGNGLTYIYCGQIDPTAWFPEPIV